MNKQNDIISSSMNQTPIWKQTMIIILALFPALMLENKYIFPLMNQLNLVIAKFINVVITVCALSWILLPLAIYLLNWWLNSKSKLQEYLGIFTVIILYLIEIGIFIIMS